MFSDLDLAWHYARLEKPYKASVRLPEVLRPQDGEVALMEKFDLLSSSAQQLLPALGPGHLNSASGTPFRGLGGVRSFHLGLLLLHRI